MTILCVVLIMSSSYSLTAMFSPAKRRQLEEGFHSPARRPLFGTNRAPDNDQTDFNEPL